MQQLEKRSNEFKFDENIVSGYAAVFNSESRDLGGFIEIIEEGAITNDTIQRSDIFAVLNHDRGHGIFARSKNGKGSLKLEIDSKGLRYEFTLADTPIAHELREYIKRGEIDSSSFAFTVSNDKWEHKGDTYYRRITSIDKLYDISPVFQPAYESASVTMRDFDEYRQAEEARIKQELEDIKRE